MEEQERDAGGACEFHQADLRAAQPDSLGQSTKHSESGAQLELHKNPDTHLKEESLTFPIPENPASFQTSSGPPQTGNVILFDQNGRPLHCESMVLGQSGDGQVYVIPSSHLGGTQVLLPSVQALNTARGTCIAKPSQEEKLTLALTADNSNTNTLTTAAPPGFTAIKTQTVSSPDVFVPPLKLRPASAPNWAKRLRSCEKIGDSYRGYCNTEAELEALLLLHKQHTHSVFGTRQSPSPAKPATRLMWKSQYVPYDGIPFVNAGSRAIVMECQFGPRRKGVQPKRGTAQESSESSTYKATCPARIYIKKVRKFPEYEVPVNPKVDKKVVRQEQEKAFFNLKKKLWDTGGVIRYYIQLPTQKAHLYHYIDIPALPPLPEQPDLPEEETEDKKDEEVQKEREGDGEADDGGAVPSRLHPLVAEKIKELVVQGCNQVYAIRRQLRRFVEREMFKSDAIPERHNLCYFPTINDIKNHMHEAQKNMQMTEATLASLGAEWKAEGENLLAETVTLTLTPATINVSSQKEGILEGSDTLSPEAVQLFSSVTSFQPKIFAQLQGVQLQPTTCPAEGTLDQQPVSAAEPSDRSNSLNPHTLFLSPMSFLQSSHSVGAAVAVPETAALLEMGQLVNVSALEVGGPEGSATQVLLGDSETIPLHIVDSSSIAMSASVEEASDKHGHFNREIQRTRLNQPQDQKQNLLHVFHEESGHD